MIKRPIKLK